MERTCTVVHGEGEGDSQPLSSLRDRDAYVLLGAPGAGKTVAFEHESCRAGGWFVRARDFITYEDRPEWHGKTLYIDGLDEKRAGSSDRRTPLDDMRAKLYSLGRPRFRLSCREADWFGAPDRTSLLSAAPRTTVDVLRLDPLTDDDVREILRHLGVGMSMDFWRRRERTASRGGCATRRRSRCWWRRWATASGRRRAGRRSSGVAGRWVGNGTGNTVWRRCMR